MKYFDYTATTPVDDEVLQTYVNTTKNFFANTTSLHKLGEESNHMLEVCKKGICDILNLKHHNVIFTSNATEANNLAIFGVACKNKKGKIITTQIEHPSVFNTCKELENDENYEVVYLNISNNGLIDINQLKEEMNDDVILVSIMWVNNIIGTVQDIKSIIEIVKAYPKARLHIDMVQGMCKVIPNFDFNDIDMFTMSTHKIYGPKGIGALFIKDNIDIKKRIFGSSAQYSIKPGTLDVSLIACTYKAIKKFYPKTLENLNDVKAKYLYLYDRIKDNENIIINTPLNNISYYIMSIAIKGIKGETSVHYLENKEIYVSTGSSCSSKLVKPEKTILALSNDDERAINTIRISLSPLVKYEEIDELINALNNLCKLGK